MESSGLEQSLSESAAEVLESMFFASPMETAGLDESAPPPSISAQLSFKGARRGRFGVRVSEDAAKTLAASFLGDDNEAITDEQSGEVLCEMANMLCGSVLSRMAEGARFELSQPLLDQPPVLLPEHATATAAFDVEEGSLLIWLHVEEES